MSQEGTGRRLRVTVLAGGSSAEREVSLDSGRCVAEALKSRGHDVSLVDPAVSPLRQIARDTEILFPLLHGTGAEDGTLQEQLSSLDVPWIGSSAEASRLTFDKIATRNVLLRAGLPVAPGRAVSANSGRSEIERLARELGFPLVVKPARQGSSVGISIIQTPDDIQAAVEESLRWDTHCLLEQFVDGREITVPVIDGRVFPVIEILPARAWYDYVAKYSDDATGYRMNPTGLPAELTRLVEQALQVCGVTGISRTDLRISRQGECRILEINTIPGMTSHSLVPMSARALGLSTGELCEQILLRKLAETVRRPAPVAMPNHRVPESRPAA